MRIALLAALPVLLAPRPAWPCGGDSGGDSGGSSGGGSSSSDSGSSDSGSSSSAPACVDTTAIVGRAECSRFGSWDSARTPPIIIGVGGSLHFFSLRGLRFAGTAEHDIGVRYAVVGEEATDGAVASTWDLRTTMNLGRYLFAGLETQAGKLYMDRRTLQQGDLVVQPSGGGYLVTGLLAGVRVPMGDLELRAEAVAGVRMMTVNVTSRMGECVDESAVSDIAPMVETRLGAATWLSPWLTLSASVGTSPIDRSAVSGGIALEGHLRAFDGGR